MLFNVKKRTAAAILFYYAVITLSSPSPDAAEPINVPLALA